VDITVESVKARALVKGISNHQALIEMRKEERQKRLDKLIKRAEMSETTLSLKLVVIDLINEIK